MGTVRLPPRSRTSSVGPKCSGREPLPLCSSSQRFSCGGAGGRKEKRGLVLCCSSCGGAGASAGQGTRAGGSVCWSLGKAISASLAKSCSAAKAACCAKLCPACPAWPHLAHALLGGFGRKAHLALCIDGALAPQALRKLAVQLRYGGRHTTRCQSAGMWSNGCTRWHAAAPSMQQRVACI